VIDTRERYPIRMTFKQRSGRRHVLVPVHCTRNVREIKATGRPVHRRPCILAVMLRRAVRIRVKVSR
jgi:hypothetical protein